MKAQVWGSFVCSSMLEQKAFFAWRTCNRIIIVNVPPPIEAGASCFDENSTTAPRNCGDLHSLHRRRFPCDPRYYKLR